MLNRNPNVWHGKPDPGFTLVKHGWRRLIAIVAYSCWCVSGVDTRARMQGLFAIVAILGVPLTIP